MTPIKIILIATTLLFFATYFVFFRSRLRDRLFILAAIAGIICVVLFPNATTAIAHTVGVGRGTDLILYLVCLFYLFLFFLFYTRILVLERDLTELVRHIAILHAQPPLRTLSTNHQTYQEIASETQTLIKDDEGKVVATQLRLNSKTLGYCCLAILLAAAAIVRFSHVTSMGLTLGDGTRYIEAGRQWASGNFEYLMGGHYRPIAFAYLGCAIKTLGYNDYSIKIFNGLLGIIDLALLYCISCMIFKDRFVSLLPVLLTAFLYHVVFFSRSEMIHTPSALGLTVSLLLFILGTYNRISLFYVLLSAIALGCTANIHPDLSFEAPWFVLLLFLAVCRFERNAGLRKCLKKGVTLCFLYSICFFLPYIVGLIYYGPHTVISAMQHDALQAKNYSESFASHTGFVQRMVAFYDVYHISLMQLTGNDIWFIMVTLIPLVIIGLALAKRRFLLLTYYPVVLLFGYGIIYILFSKNFDTASFRIFIPLLPLAALSIVFWSWQFVQFILELCLAFSKKHTKLVLLLGKVIICAACLILFSTNRQTLPNDPSITASTIYRTVYDQLKGKVDADHQLLVTPYVQYRLDKGFAHPLYFGPNVKYVYDFTSQDGSFYDILKKNKIQYIFVSTKNYDMRFKNQNLIRNYQNILQDCYGISQNGEYSAEKELSFLEKYLATHGEEIASTYYGKIYKLLR